MEFFEYLIYSFNTQIWNYIWHSQYNIHDISILPDNTLKEKKISNYSLVKKKEYIKIANLKKIIINY